MEFKDFLFSVVLDKGILDVLMVDDLEVVNEDINKLFCEVGRVLKFGGRYVCIFLM